MGSGLGYLCFHVYNAVVPRTGEGVHLPPEQYAKDSCVSLLRYSKLSQLQDQDLPP